MPRGYVFDGIFKSIRTVETAGGFGFSMRTAVAIGIRYEVDAADGVRVGAPHGDAREAHGELRPPMQAAAQGDELAAAGVNLGKECRAFVRLGAGGAEEALLQIAGRDARELLGEVDEVLREVDVADVLESFRLCGDGGGDFRIAVSAVDDGDARETVEITPPLVVVEVLHLAAHDLPRFTVKMPETGHDVFFLFFEDGSGADVLRFAAGGCSHIAPF